MSSHLVNVILDEVSHPAAYQRLMNKDRSRLKEVSNKN